MKKALFSVCVLILLFVFCGCRQDAPGSDESATIRVLSVSNAAVPVAESVWDEFNRIHPEITILREDVSSGNYDARVNEYLAQGDLPEVIYCWADDRLVPLLSDNHLKDLKPFLMADGIFYNYMPIATAPQIGGYLGEITDKIVSSSVTYVNRSVLDANGLSVPETYDDLIHMVDVLVPRGIKVISMDCEEGYVMQSSLLSLVAGRYGGADWYEKLVKGETSFADGWFRKSLQVIKNLYDDGIIDAGSLDSAYDSGKAPFAAGDAAIYIDGDWGSSAFKMMLTEEQQENIDLIVFPSLPDEVFQDSCSIMVGTGWGMSSYVESGSAEERAAWKLIKFLEGEYAQASYFVAGSTYPTLATLDIARICETYNMDPIDKKQADYYKQIRTGTPIIDGVLPSEVYSVIDDGVTELGRGSKSVDQVVDAVQAAWAAYVAP